MQRFQIVNTVKIIPPSSSHFLVTHNINKHLSPPFPNLFQPHHFLPSPCLVGIQPSSKLAMDSTAATTEMSSMTTTTDYRKTAPESGYAARSPPPNFFGTDFALRLLLLASSVSALVVLVTSKQTKHFPTGLPPPYPPTVSRAADFEHSPALIYLVAALAVTALYSILTIVTSSFAISNPSPSPEMLFHLITFDALMAGVMASATGTAGAVAYIGLKGNHHVQWNKICNIYGKFCRHIGSSVLVSLVASVVLVLLVVLSSYSLYRRSR